MVIGGSMKAARLIVDEAQAGSWNMAVDQALLQAANQQGLVTLRFYQWVPATLSLGYFQAVADRAAHPPSQRCPLVRRASGGGAIVHDHEWTYSLCLPAGDRLSRQHELLVADMHGILADLLREYGLEARRFDLSRGGPHENARWRANPFLCFQRRAAGDLVSGPHKICGSAQRRIDGAILQHGSLLVSRSPAAPELPGINQLMTREIALNSDSGFLTAWAAAVEKKWALRLEPGQLGDQEVELAQFIQASRFSNPSWTRRR